MSIGSYPELVNVSMYLSDGIKICQCQKTETRPFNIKVYAKIKNLKIAKIRMMAKYCYLKKKVWEFGSFKDFKEYNLLISLQVCLNIII